VHRMGIGCLLEDILVNILWGVLLGQSRDVSDKGYRLRNTQLFQYPDYPFYGVQILLSRAI